MLWIVHLKYMLEVSGYLWLNHKVFVLCKKLYIPLCVSWNIVWIAIRLSYLAWCSVSTIINMRYRVICVLCDTVSARWSGASGRFSTNALKLACIAFRLACKSPSPRYGIFQEMFFSTKEWRLNVERSEVDQLYLGTRVFGNVGCPYMGDGIVRVEARPATTFYLVPSFPGWYGKIFGLMVIGGAHNCDCFG